MKCTHKHGYTIDNQGLCHNCGLPASDWDLPDTLPDNWKFPPPPVCTTQWSEKDWVIYAAPYNNGEQS